MISMCLWAVSSLLNVSTASASGADSSAGQTEPAGQPVRPPDEKLTASTPRLLQLRYNDETNAAGRRRPTGRPAYFIRAQDRR